MFKKKQNFYDFLCGLFLFFIPISVALPNILLPFLGVLFILNFRNINKIIPRYLLMFFFTIMIIFLRSYFFSNNIDSSIFLKFSMIFVIFIFFTQAKNIKYLEYAFLGGIFTAVIGSSLEIWLYILEHPDFLLANGSLVNELLWLERPYFGFLNTLGLYICLNNARKSKGRYDYYILAIILLAFNIYISARLGILLCALIMFVFLIKNHNIKKYHKLGFGIAAIVTIFIAMGLSDNLLERMKITNDIDKTKHLLKVYEPRFVIWPCSYEIVSNKMNLFIGLGNYKNVESELANCYSSTIKNPSKKEYYLLKRFNTHNQFLDFLLVGGIIPFILLLSVFWIGWFSNGTFEVKVILILFFAFFMVENVLHRQLGCYLFGIFTALYSRRTLNGKN
ncbi:O-antigen ligase family protein [Mesonia mobilis]|uniref:O-antigen ligase family protein n=1 Tax=Mesonia mobilis TaxID=369791 RepID=UPI00167AF4F8|nr:O-antigen ligase family protein [Mesonia mobilis]